MKLLIVKFPIIKDKIIFFPITSMLEYSISVVWIELKTPCAKFLCLKINYVLTGEIEAITMTKYN